MKFESQMGPKVSAVFNLSGDILSESIPAELVTGIPLFDNVVELLDRFCVGIERGFSVGKDGIWDVLIVMRTMITPNTKNRIIIKRGISRKISFLKIFFPRISGGSRLILSC